MTNMTGRCMCGKIHWAITGPIRWQAHCHCEDCRRNTSSPFTSFIGVADDNIKWSGPTPVSYASSSGVSRAFCGDCGAPVFFKSDEWPDEIHVYAASLDDPSRYVPQGHVFWADRVEWCDVHDALPKFPTTSATSKPEPDAP